MIKIEEEGEERREIVLFFIKRERETWVWVIKRVRHKKRRRLKANPKLFSERYDLEYSGSFDAFELKIHLPYVTAIYLFPMIKFVTKT